MIRHCQPATLLFALASSLLACGTLGISSNAAADEPPATTPPANDAGRHHNPAWAACKKQADDQKLEPGDARRDFMKNCMKSTHAAAPTAS